MERYISGTWLLVFGVATFLAGWALASSGFGGWIMLAGLAAAVCGGFMKWGKWGPLLGVYVAIGAIVAILLVQFVVRQGWDRFDGEDSTSMDAVTPSGK